MNDKVFIVLCKGEIIYLSGTKIVPKHFPSGARFFEAPDDTKLIILCRWFRTGTNISGQGIFENIKELEYVNDEWREK